MSDPRCAVIVPAHNEEQLVGATVRAALSLPWVDQVVVVDDGSDDGTVRAAADAGARVIQHLKRLGKGRALETGVANISKSGGADERRVMLFLDADLAESAGEALPLIETVVRGETDVSIGVLPKRPAASAGGRGLVVGMSRWAIRSLTSWNPAQPLSGQRCLTQEAFESVRPLARGFGVETAMTIDLLRGGFRVREVETKLSHRVTGKDLRSNAHRARQLWEVGRALAPRLLWRRKRESRSKRPSHIAIVVGQTAGGIGRHALSLAKQVVANGGAVSVFGPEVSRGLGFEAEGATFEPIVVPVSFSVVGLLRSSRRLARSLHGTDLIHAHGLRAGIVAGIAGRRAGVAHRLVTVHNAVLDRSARTRLMESLLNRALARLTTLRICVSRDLAKVHREANPSRSGTVQVLAVGAEILPISSDEIAEARRSVGAAKESSLIVAAGRLHSQKGFDVLIEAASSMDRDDVCFVIAGDGPQRPHLEALIAQRGLDSRVKLVGERSDSVALISSADIFCMPSRWEGSPLALHEAMAAGRPVVATTVGGIPDMLSDEEGLLVSPEDPQTLATALNRMLNDTELASRLGAGARRRAADWPDASKTASLVTLLYESLLSRPLRAG